MPFEKRTVMEQKLEFCMLASSSDANISDLCRKYKISRFSGYKWLNRFLSHGFQGLKELSRKPNHSPLRISPDMESYIADLRKENKAWGSKKVRKILMNQQQEGIYPFNAIPCKNTITRIFNRNGLIQEENKEKSRPQRRFEYEEPNFLWQMDFKGFFYLLDQSRCYPLTILDDHSRFNIGLFACSNERQEIVKKQLICVFRKYGLPAKILCDNGAPWGTTGQSRPDQLPLFSQIEKWLIRLNIKPIHGRAYHPQTQGKDERFHRTLKTELLNYEKFKNQVHCQNRFDIWRDKYNCQRPHEALDFEFPVMRYKPSPRPYPEVLPPIEYDSTDIVRKVMDKGLISFKSKSYRVGKAFIGDHVALRQISNEQQYDVYFCNQRIRTIDTSKSVSDVYDPL